MDSCLDDDHVLGFVEGTIGASGRAVVEAHIARCPECRQLVAETAKAYFPPGADTTTVPRSSKRPPDAPVSILERGAAVGRYRVAAPIGEGGMGIVYEAYDPQLDRHVALKLLRAPAEEDPTAAERLLREARAMARIAHPNVVAVYDAGAFGEHVFVAMELVQGTTVAEWLVAHRPGWREALRVLREAGRGLAAAHAAGLVHRDFKPQNVLVGPADRVRVTDFGLARPTAIAPEPRAEGVAATQPLSGTLTRTGALVGTPAYMAPEQLFRSGAIDALSDQFSFAVALYEALYRERPFSGTTFVELAAEVGRGRVRPASAAVVVPNTVRDVLLRALSVKREHRFGSMDEMLLALDAATAPTPEVSAPAIPAAPRAAISKRGTALVAGAIATVAAVLVIVGARARATADPPEVAQRSAGAAVSTTDAPPSSSATAEAPPAASEASANVPPEPSAASKDVRSAAPRARVPARRPRSQPTAVHVDDDSALKPIGGP